ncbi:MAG: hypothetical protein KGZ39_01115 [Simkania sp.]|nr:hypothetical protein [Simkania sp.]
MLGPTGQPLPSRLLGTNDSPLQFVPGSTTDLMYYNNAQIQEMITYFANEAQGKTGSSLTQVQLQMQPWTNAGQLSSAQSSNQQGQLKNTSDTWTQQLQAVQGNLTSAVQAGSTAVGLQSYAAQVLGSGTS